MSSTLSATNINCIPSMRIPCFTACMDYLVYQPISENTVDFRPYYSTVTEDGISCSCSSFNVYGAVINDNNRQAQGASPDGSPFFAAVLIGNSNSIDGRFFLTTSQICNVRYELTGGSSVLGVEYSYTYSYFYLWWVVLISCLVFCCCCCICTRFCCLKGEQAGKTLGPPPGNQSNPPPAFEPESTFAEFPPPAESYVLQGHIPMATAVPVTAAMAESENIPTADEVKNTSSNNERELALV